MADKKIREQTVGDRIRAAREKSGWNTSELSIQADVGLEQISRYENGSRMPGLENLIKIADALHQPLDVFQPSSLDRYGSSSPEEAEILAAIRALSPLKRKEACEHILSIIRLMK